MKDGGMLVSIGTESVVIIDQPVIDGKEVDIVEDISGQGYTFAPSGLQGISGKPNYRINPKYIVGYVDKLNNQVIANHLYYNYEILQENLDQVENNPKAIPLNPSMNIWFKKFLIFFIMKSPPVKRKT